PAKIGDIDDLMDLFYRVKNGLAEAGLNQWPDWYPRRKRIEENIHAEQVFLHRIDAAPIATITLNQIQDPAYRKITWSLHDDSPWVVHRLVVDPGRWGQGLGKRMMLFAEDEVRKQGGGVIRLDTWVGNPGSIALYNSLGYTRAEGYCYFYGPDQPFACLEKRVD
ncbi:MAG: GNAT family N-acetyltransferase, partial [Saprospiraceae bacterium]|nr:GNAT family N-acetyltransferase [Saprospiraceae bacterium]